MLDLNSNRRITVEQALKHPYVAEWHDEEEEPVFAGHIDFSFEQDKEMGMSKVQRLIIGEVAAYDPAYLEYAAPL